MIAACRRAFAERHILPRSWQREPDHDPVASRPAWDWIVNHPVQSGRADTCRCQQLPRPDVARVANLQRAVAVADVEQPRKLDALDHQHDCAVAYPANTVPVIVARDDMIMPPASCAGNIARFRVRISKAYHAG